MFNLVDEFSWTKQKKTITQDKHKFAGLGNFSHWNYTTSSTPSPMHYHSNIIEIHCMIKGKRYTQIEKGGELTKYITTGNQAFITYPYEVHSNGTEPQAPCEFYAFQVITESPYHMLGLNEEYSYALYNILKGIGCHQLTLGSTHISMLRSAFNFFSEFTEESIMVGVQFLTCFLFNLQFLAPVKESENLQIDWRIKKSIEYLTENITENLQLADLADASGYSLSRFKVKFKEEIGITPAEYINLRKFEIAKRQLSETNITVTDLAYALGFSSVSYFSSVFKKLSDSTPQDYRKNHSKKKEHGLKGNLNLLL